MQEFHPKQVYFMVWYADEEEKLPYFDSLIFIGKNLEEEDAGRETWYFQDTRSYAERGTFLDFRPDDEGAVYLLHEEDLYQIVDGPGLIGEINEWLART